MFIDFSVVIFAVLGFCCRPIMLPSGRRACNFEETETCMRRFNKCCLLVASALCKAISRSINAQLRGRGLAALILPLPLSCL